jgi:hypothetical protein
MKGVMLMPRVTQVVIILILLASSLGLGGCNTGSPASPVNLQMSFICGAPHLNQVGRLRCVVKTPALTADNVTVKINLPDGIEFVRGDLYAQFGTMSEGDKKQITAYIKPIRTGYYTIEAKLSLVPRDPAYSLGPGLFEIYLEVAENWARWGKHPPWISLPPSDKVGERPPPPSISPYEK